MILVKLILAHLIGDFFLQPKSWINDKEKRKWRSSFLYVHIFIHFALILLILWDFSYWPAALIIAGSHLLIDGFKLQLQTDRTKTFWFGADQFLHMLILIAVWVYFWNENVFQTPGDSFWLILTGVLFLTYPSSIIMMNLMSHWNGKIENENDGSLEGAGKYIGILERIFVYMAVVGGYLQVVGFLLAAKSIFRFGDLTRSKDRKLTEYILIGTLLSFLIAIITGMIVALYLD